jgi:hypothetical protein
MALAIAEDVLLPLTDSAHSSGGSGYGPDLRVRQAQAAAEEEQVRVKLDITKRELGELLSIKKKQAEFESLRKDTDWTEWNPENEQASEVALRRAKNDAMRCTQVRVFTLLHM